MCTATVTKNSSLVTVLINKNHSFLQKKYVNSTWHFVKFRGRSLLTPQYLVNWKIINLQFKISNTFLFVSVNVMQCTFAQTADKTRKQ